MDKLRIGFVGVGQMGQAAHLRNYATLPDCEVAAIAELRPRLAREVAGRYGVSNVYASHEEMLSAERLDGIVASQPFQRHGVLLPELLKAGVPLFCEKPLAASVEVGEQIVGAAEGSGATVMVGYNKRSDPATIRAKQEIDRLKDSAELGALRYVRITMPPGDWIAAGFDELIRTDEPTGELETDPPAPDMDEATFARHVAFVNYYIHQVNLMRHLLGEPYRVAHADPAGVLLVTESESGVPGAIEMSPYSTTADWQESALVTFERGYVRLDIPAPLASNRAGRVKIFSDAGGEPQRVVPQLPPVHSMRQQAINFLKVIRREMPPPCNAREALEDLKVARQYTRLLRS